MHQLFQMDLKNEQSKRSKKYKQFNGQKQWTYFLAGIT
jgi:hypothetical protein